jgi:hypothetical protein
MGGKDKSSSNQTSNSMNASNGQNASSSLGVNYGINQSGNESSQGSQQQASNQSTGSSFNESSQDVWGAQQPHLENVYNAGGDAYGQAQQGINQLQPGISSDMANAQSQAMGGFGNQMGGGYAAGLQGQVGPNSYVNALKGDMMNDAAQIKQQNLGGLDARAAASGMSGSTGYHNSANQMADNVDRQTMQGMNNLGFQAHNQGVQNQMALSSMMDRNQQGAMGNLQNMQQGAMNQFNPHMQGLNAAGQYASIIGGPTTLSQSMGGSQNQSSGQSTGSSFGSSSGFSNGMNVGMNMSGSQGFNNAYGGSSGQGTSNSSGWNIAPPSFSFAG